MNSKAVIAALFCFAVTLLLPSWLFAQKIENVKATFEQGVVTITYDLTGAKPNQKFNIELLGSHSNYSSPLVAVTGDVGKNIQGGVGKKIEWNVAAEMGVFNGNITFRVRAEPAGPAFNFIKPATDGTVRRGKTAEVKWTGGSPGQTVKLEVIQAGKVIQALPATGNPGAYLWEVPKDFAKGIYAIRLTSAGETVETGPFNVKAKIPLLVKLSPLVLVGIIIIAVLPKGGGNTPPDTPVDDDLPRAPGPQ